MLGKMCMFPARILFVRVLRSFHVSFANTRMCPRLSWFVSWESIVQSGLISMLMPILLRLWNRVHMHTQGWGQQGLLGAKSSCHLVTPLNTKKYVFSIIIQNFILFCVQDEALWNITSHLEFIYICIAWKKKFWKYILQSTLPPPGFLTFSFHSVAWSCSSWRPFSLSRRSVCITGHSSLAGDFFFSSFEAFYNTGSCSTVVNILLFICRNMFWYSFRLMWNILH